MVKCQPAALAILGILWLIRDLYALENNQRFPRKESDFYFEDVSTAGSHPVPSADAIGSFPPQGIPLQPAPSRPNDFRSVPRQDGNKNKGTKTMNDDNSEGKTNEKESVSKKKNVKKLLKDFVSLLLNLNDKEDSLIQQLTSYLGNENDPPKDVPEHVPAPPTMRSNEPKINLTTPATTTPSDTDEEDGDGASEEDDDYTSEIPQITITNIIVNVTPNPGEHVNEPQPKMPAVNKYKPMDIFHHQEEMGIIPNNEFIDDIINSPKNTLRNEDENPKNSTEPSKIKQKPSNHDENASNPGNENSTKNPISMGKGSSNEGNYNKDGNQFPQVQIPSEEPWNLSPISTQRSYQIPFIPEANPNFQNQEKENTENQMPNQQNVESQISDPYPIHQDFYSKPIAFIPRRINYDRKPTYNYEPVPNMRNHIFRTSPQFFPKIIPLPIKSYNQQHANGSPAPKIVYPQEVQPQANQPQSDISSETVPFIPKYSNDPNAAISNDDTINPANSEKNEDKTPVDNIVSDSPLKIDSRPRDGLHLGRNPQPSKNKPLPQTKKNRNDRTPCNKLSVHNNSKDDSVSKENEKANLASTEFTLLLNHTEMAKKQNVSTTEASTQPPENNFYSTIIPVPQKKASPLQNKLTMIRPFLKRNRFRKTKQQNKKNNSTSLKDNQDNSTLELPLEKKLNYSDLSPENKLNNSEVSPANKSNDSELSLENKLNDSKVSPENGENSQQESPNNQESSTKGSVPRNSSIEIVPTSEAPLMVKPSLRNISLPLDSKQSTDAPETETQSTTSSDDSNETDSEESDDYEPSSEEDSSGEADDEEHDNTSEEEHDNADDGHEPDNEDTLHSNSDDEDAFHDINDTDGSNDNDKGVENILNDLDKVSTNNATTDVPQNSTIPILASTESSQNQKSDLNKSSLNPPAPSTNDANKNPQNLSTPSTDNSSESPRNPPIPSAEDANKNPKNRSVPSTDESPQNPPVPPTDESSESPQNPSVPSTDESNESTQNPPLPPPTNDFKKSPQNSSIPITNHPTKSPKKLRNGNQNSNRPIAKGPPYDNILDYIYSYSKNPFFKELKDQQDSME